MLDLAFAQIVQLRPPMPILLQIFRDSFREQDVPAIAAIHHSLRHVDAWPGDIRAPTDIGYLADRAAVNTHSHWEVGMCFKRLRDLECAPRGLFRAIAKDQRHPIARRQLHELLVSRFAHLRRPEHDFGELAQALSLPLDQKLRITNDIDEQDMTDLEGDCLSASGAMDQAPFPRGEETCRLTSDRFIISGPVSSLPMRVAGTPDHCESDPRPDRSSGTGSKPTNQRGMAEQPLKILIASFACLVRASISASPVKAIEPPKASFSGGSKTQPIVARA